jgi:hypothetical protein
MRGRARRRERAGPLRWWLGLAALAAVLGSSQARANGRFPRSERVIEDPSDHDHLLLAATYGLLTTSDRGAHWYHVCEAAFAGDPTYIGDPILELVAGNALLVDVQASVRRSPDGCTWSSTLGPAGGAAAQNVDDLVVARTGASPGATVLAVVTRLVDGGESISLQQSTDAGLTWHAVGAPLPLSLVTTIDLDPTDATHIYATGLAPAGQGDTGLLLTSTNGGSTWTSRAIPNTGSNDVPYIAAIDPTAPDKIFVRTDATTFPADAPEVEANDALLYSANGGASWQEVLRETANLLGFALSPDGTTVLAGYGDPVESAIYVDPTVTGLYEASTSDFVFSLVYPGSVTGLTWATGGVYTCLSQPVSGSFEQLAFFASGDLVADAAAPTQLMKLNDVDGPVPCCAAVDSVCDWSSVCATYKFFSCADGGPPAVSCVDAGADAGASSRDAGTPASTDAAVPPVADATDDATLAPVATAGAAAASGCTCHAGAANGGRTNAGRLCGAAALVVLVTWRRKTGKRPRVA